MKKNWKRLGSLVLALALLVSMIPLSAAAEGSDEASINGTTYATLAEAFANVPDGQLTEIKLEKDVVVDDPITIPKEKKIVFDLQEYGITVSPAFKTRLFTNNGTLTIKGKGSVDVTAAGADGYGTVNNYGTLTVVDGTYKNLKESDASNFYNRNGGTATFENPTIHGGGGCVATEVNTITTIHGGYYENETYPAIDNRGKMTITAGTFKNTSCSSCDENKWGYTIRSGESSETAYLKIKGETDDSVTVTGVQGGLAVIGGTADIYNGYYKTVLCKTHTTGASAFYAGYFTGESYATSTNIYGGTFTSATKTGIQVGNDNPAPDSGAGENSTVMIYGGTFIGGDSTKTAITVKKEDYAIGAAKVFGGTFSSDVSAYVPSYCSIEKNEKGEWTVLENTTGIATVGGKFYTTLSAAIAAAEAGETVTLLKDTEVDQQIVIDEKITLDLGGHTLTNAYVATGSDEEKFSMITREDVVIQNGKYASTGEVTTEYETRGIRASSGNLTLKNMTATCKGLNVCNYALNSTLTIENATIRGDYAVSTFNNKVTVKITDSVLEGTTCGLYHNGSFYGLILNVTGTTIKGEKGGSSAAGADDTTAVYISGSTITTENNGGKNQQASFTNCVVSGSTGIEVKYTDLKLEGCTVSTTSTKEPTFEQFNNGSTTSGFSVVATDNSMEPNDPAPGGSVTITDGYYKGLVGLASFFEETNQYPGFKEADYTISAGYFTHDPSAYLEEGKIAVISDKDGYNFTVADKTTVAEVVVAEPEVPAPDFPKGDERKELAQKVVEALVDPEVGGAAPPAIDETILTAAANEKANENTLKATDAVVTKALEDANVATEEETVSIVIQPYLEIVVKDVVAKGSGEAAALQAITLDVTPMYRTVATTADLSDPNAEIKLPSEDVKAPNAAQIGKSKKLTITKPVTVTIPLPNDFAPDTPPLYVKHVKDNGRTYYYKGNVDAKVLTFINPNGFSLMTISAENGAVAEVNSVGYGTLQEALADAADGDTVKILKNDLTASMSGSSRTITLQNEAGANITVTINGEVLTIDAGESIKYKYTRPGGGGTTEAEPFTDVDEDDWFYDEVVYVYENGLMQGTSDTAFSPKNEMDRAMLVTTLYRMEGEPAVSGVDVPFTDVTEGYYVDAVAWAYANDIVSGYEDNTFQPKKAITREQYVTILHRYAQFKGMDVSSSGDLSAFTDAEKVSGWAEEAMIWAVDTELMQGVTETTIAPRKTAQRCQGAALLTRFHQMMA